MVLKARANRLAPVLPAELDTLNFAELTFHALRRIKARGRAGLLTRPLVRTHIGALQHLGSRFQDRQPIPKRDVRVMAPRVVTTPAHYGRVLLDARALTASWRSPRCLRRPRSGRRGARPVRGRGPSRPRECPHRPRAPSRRWRRCRSRSPLSACSPRG
jgi:hypothetical protein